MQLGDSKLTVIQRSCGCYEKACHTGLIAAPVASLIAEGLAPLVQSIQEQIHQAQEAGALPRGAAKDLCQPCSRQCKQISEEICPCQHIKCRDSSRQAAVRR